MRVLDKVIIKRPMQPDAVIQLLQGDLSAIPEEHATDILIISAYPGSYIPVEGTLIAALHCKGLDVAEMANNKSIDLRDQLGCWLSQPLSATEQAQFHFKKILCFEPWQKTTEQTSVVGNIFRCINTFAFSENNNVVAMPVLSSGEQKISFEKMLPAMLDASIFWLESGLPLTSIKLVLHSDQQAAAALPVFVRARQQNELKQSLREGCITGKDALEILATEKQASLPGEASLPLVLQEINEIAQKETVSEQAEPPPSSQPAQAIKKTVLVSANNQPAAAPNPEQLLPRNSEQPGAPLTSPAQYDYFISYAHRHAPIVDAFVESLIKANSQLKLFYDKTSIPVGGLWIKQISDAIQKAKRVLIFLSPEYSNSPVCWDEFQCAKLMEYNSRKPMIQTIYLYNDATMPPIMGVYSWADCREGDKDKLQQMADQIIREMAANP